MSISIPKISANRFDWDDYFGATVHLNDIGLKEIPQEFIIVDDYQETEYHFVRRSFSTYESTRIDIYDGMIDENDSSVSVYSYSDEEQFK